eukprot:6982940-Pyramimonas_sp.AAC.1
MEVPIASELNRTRRDERIQLRPRITVVLVMEYECDGNAVRVPRVSLMRSSSQPQRARVEDDRGNNTSFGSDGTRHFNHCIRALHPLPP